MNRTQSFTDLNRVWRRFRKTKDRRLRNQIVEAYLPLVRHNAEKIAGKLPAEVDQEDLVSAGVFGLMDAIQGFDLARGVKFETYCTQRIRGAMIDELRSMDWVPRLVRQRAQVFERAIQEMEVDLGRVPTNDEMAHKLSMDEKELERVRKDAAKVTVSSLSKKFAETDSHRDFLEVDVLPDHRGMNPMDQILRQDLRELISRGLSRAERLVLFLYYYEEMTMRDIGQTLDLSESRVSQMHTAVMKRLREHLARRLRELGEEL